MAKKRMINGEVPVNEVRQVGEGARGALPPALRATSPAAAEEAGNSAERHAGKTAEGRTS